tara:strand:+ start:763 stop:957 length:195 start_codon:yes stop_codon:yes gene_type:complete
MINLVLQDDEARAVEKVLDLILTTKSASEVVFKDGDERRCAVRASKKIYWAMGGNLMSQNETAA